jgi:hypothetical protein
MKHVTMMITIGVAAVGLSGTADASTQTIRLNGFVSVGAYCEATFTRNPAVLPVVDGINFKSGGPIGAAPPDPGFWHINSPTVVMPDGTTGIHTVDNINGIEWDESNTVAHNGVFSPGLWTVALKNAGGVACNVYDNQVKVTFTLIP